MERIFVDTNVLFPFSIMDLLLALTEDGIHEVLWSQDLLDEWQRVVTRDYGRSQATAESITLAVRDFFADSEVPESDYRSLIDDMPGNDPDDRAHMAAAIAGHAASIVTWNLKDFPHRPTPSTRHRRCRPGHLPQSIARSVSGRGSADDR